MRDTLNAPDYWQTDNSTGLVMVIRNYHWLNSASLHHWFKQESVNKHTLFDLDFWPMTLTYNPRLAKVKVDSHAKIKVKQFKQESAHRQTDGHAHARTLPNVLSPLQRGR